MRDGVHYNIEAVREFKGRLENFRETIEDLQSRLNSAVSSAAAEWQDAEFNKAAEHASTANAAVSSALGGLYDDAAEFIRKQEEWDANWNS